MNKGVNTGNSHMNSQMMVKDPRKTRQQFGMWPHLDGRCWTLWKFPRYQGFGDTSVTKRSYLTPDKTEGPIRKEL